MTATTPRWRGPSTPVGGPTLASRWGGVYGFPILDPSDGQVHDDYIGKTTHPIAVREAEHRGLGRNPDDEQPWSDLIVGKPFLIEEGLWTAEELAARERYWIRNYVPHRPRYNWLDNEGCPGQIPKWVAREQRAERDRARGLVTRWTVPAGPVVRRVVVAPAGPGVAGVVLRSRWTWLALAWVAASVGVWAAVDRLGVVLPARWHLGVAVAVPLVVALAAWRWWTTRGRRKLRRLTRWFR